MEPIPINEIFVDEITIINSSLTLPRTFKADVWTTRVIQSCVTAVIDKLGEQSATAQGLNKIITTTEKLRNSESWIYLLKDAKAKEGKGDIIGMLKVGRKKLYLNDESMNMFQFEPLCVLDFFVQKDRQRQGHGRKLFNFMLEDQKTQANMLAVDGPSSNMENFLIKNYDMGRLIRQNNNFAVSARFFELNAADISRPSSMPKSPAQATGRYSAPQPRSAIAKVIHGDQQSSTDCISGMTTPEEVRAELEKIPEPIVEPEPSPVFEQMVEPEEPVLQRPSSLKVELNSPVAPVELSPAGSTISRRDSQLTDKGYFDVKYYHNKLW